LIHTAVPVAVTDFLRYQQRCSDFSRGREELQQNLTRIDLCCSELSSAVDTLITRASQYRDDFIRQMRTWKAEVSAQIDESIAEVEATLAQEEVKLHRTYSATLRNYTPGDLVLFRFEVNSHQVDACLQDLVRTHFPESKPASPDLPEPELPEIFWVTESTIQWFDASSLQWHALVPLHSRIQVNGGSRWAIVDATRVVVCGGGKGEMYSASEGSKTAYLVGKSGTELALPDLHYGHRSPGVLVWKDRILVFGSFCAEGAREGEALRQRASQWEVLPQMCKKRCGFTAALWQEAVYLCGGWDNCSVELFDGVAVRLLALSLPEGSGAIACVSGDMLLVFTDHYLVTLSTNDGQATLTAKKRQGGGANPWTPPVLWKGVVYSVGLASPGSTKGKVYKYSADSC